MCAAITNYPLGPTIPVRKAHLRENIIRAANAFHDLGVDSRIPYLKVAYGIDGGPEMHNGTTASKELGPPVPEYQPNQIVVNAKAGDIMRFNISYRHNGLQAVPQKPQRGELMRAIVIQCKTVMMGDLRITTVPEQHWDSYIGPGGASYSATWYQVFVNSNLSACSAAKSYAHEGEHAAHYTLARMAGLDITNPQTAEYLAMLATTMYLGDGEPANAGLKWWNYLLPPRQIPHTLSAISFVSRLRNEYGMKTGEIALAVEASVAEKRESHPGFECLKKLQKYARTEFENIYQRCFGLSTGDISEVISGLPLI